MSAAGSDTAKDRGSLTDYVRMYYDHQYDRMAKLENQALTITNIVITLSTLAFTFGFDSPLGLTPISGIGLPLIMVVANAFAIAYIGRASSWSRTHRLRAKRVLELYAPDLYWLDTATSAPHKARTLSRRRIQRLLHILLIIAALIPCIIYLQSVFWS